VLECGSGVLEELLLPTVEHRGVNAVLVAQIRNRGVFEEMEPKDGDLLRDAEAIPSFLGHGKTSARDCSLFERLVLPIPTEAKQSDSTVVGCAEATPELKPAMWMTHSAQAFLRSAEESELEQDGENMRSWT
jgi:hypothetical protein